ncbi:MAG: hypothetical protein ACJAYG_002526, partial [Oceanicoccus sp.]
MYTIFSRNKVVVTSMLCLVFLNSCAFLSGQHLDKLYGKQQVVDRAVKGAIAGPEYYHDIKPIIDNRCIVCHGCYDAPCQLKMNSFEAIDRGASKDKVYDGGRLLAANISPYSAHNTGSQVWREQGFHPIFNERKQGPEANTAAGLMYRLLELKQQHPLPSDEILPPSFDLALNRDEQCPRIEEFDQYAADKPLWGMPYALPAIKDSEQKIIAEWLKNGAKVNYANLNPDIDKSEVERWETFLNGESMKEKLMSRYIYEHLFLANVYFSTSSAPSRDDRSFYKLVRSKTPPGTAIDSIITRRPFDSPATDIFYYRLQYNKATILAKQHMPYLLDDNRFERWQHLFFGIDYQVSYLPSHDPAVASNPFETFKQLPVTTRYRFMLDEAQFTIMGFIKGPVCRGQVSLNVINDHFWVIFTDPLAEEKYQTEEFLLKHSKHLSMPAEKESSALRPITSWIKYSQQEKDYIKAKQQRFDENFSEGKKVDISLLWDGDKHNRNASLTIFRHFDSATVAKGLIGDTPKTAWVISYSLLERIHYLLVAGFDVYGNVGHQLLTRLYMDFLRMEGENSFLKLLPKDTAKKELEFWYRGEEKQVADYINELNSRDHETSAIKYTTDNPKKEFFQLLKKHVGSNVIAPDIINSQPALPTFFTYQSKLQRLSTVKGIA